MLTRYERYLTRQALARTPEAAERERERADLEQQLNREAQYERAAVKSALAGRERNGHADHT
jgi:hypothetical protein